MLFSAIISVLALLSYQILEKAYVSDSRLVQSAWHVTYHIVNRLLSEIVYQIMLRTTWEHLVRDMVYMTTNQMSVSIIFVVNSVTGEYLAI